MQFEREEFTPDTNVNALFSAPIQIQNPGRLMVALQLPEDAEFPEEQRAVERDWIADKKAEDQRWLAKQHQRLQNFPWGMEQRWEQLLPPRSREDEARAWRQPTTYQQDFHSLFSQH